MGAQVRARGGLRELEAVRECAIGSPAVGTGCLLFSSDSRTLLICSRDGALHSLRLQCRAVENETLAPTPSASTSASNWPSPAAAAGSGSSKRELALAKYRHTRKRGPALALNMRTRTVLYTVQYSITRTFLTIVFCHTTLRH